MSRAENPRYPKVNQGEFGVIFGKVARAITKFRDDPVGFHRHVLGRPPFHAAQARIAQALVDHRVVVAPGAHSVGKSWLAGSLVPWWMLTRAPAIVLCTSPSYAQLTGVLWKAVQAAALSPRLQALGLLDPRAVGADAIRLEPDRFAVARTSNAAERVSGYHSPHLLVITDESSAIDEDIWDAISGLGAERLLILGNPVRAQCKFRDYYKLAVAGTPGYAAVHLTAHDSPHATLTDDEVKARGLPAGLTSKTWIDDVRVRYGESSPYWRTRVLAEFPDSDETVVFQEAWLDRCVDAAIRPKELGRSRWIACDPAGGTGRDRSAILVRDEHQVLALESSTGWGLEQCAAAVGRMQAKFCIRSDHVVFDATGLGTGLGLLLGNAIPYRGGESGGAEWTNTRTAAAMNAARRLNPDMPNSRPFYIPRDILGQLRPELLELKLRPDDDEPRRQRLEAKEELKKRLGRSPDVGDAFCMSFLCGSDLPDFAFAPRY